MIRFMKYKHLLLLAVIIVCAQSAPAPTYELRTVPQPDLGTPPVVECDRPEWAHHPLCLERSTCRDCAVSRMFRIWNSMTNFVQIIKPNKGIKYEPNRR